MRFVAMPPSRRDRLAITAATARSLRACCARSSFDLTSSTMPRPSVSRRVTSGQPPRDIFVVGNRQDHGVGRLAAPSIGVSVDAIFALGLLAHAPADRAPARRRRTTRSSRTMSTTLELRMSGTFSLKVSAEHRDGTPVPSRWRQMRRDAFARDALAHAVVDAPAGEDHLGMIARLLGAMRQVIGIDADAVPADQARMRTAGNSIWSRPPPARRRCRCRAAGRSRTARS